MSFILEALKKVDRKKGDDPQDGVVMRGGRRWGETRFPWALTASVAVAIVALTVASVALFRSLPREETGTSEPANAGVAQPEAVATGVSGGTPSSEGVAVSSSQDTGSLQSVVVEDVEPTPIVEAVSEEDAGATTPDASGEVEGEPEPAAAAPPVNLVGRAADEPTQVQLEEGGDAEPPSGLPPLELQGTSVIDGKPVAVVNYQRLFEGDFIEGARVVKILDRAVELEFEGTRFTLRL